MRIGLEALKEIDFELNYETLDDNGYSLENPIKARNFFEKEISIIEKELKALEIIKPFLKNIRIVKNEKGQYEVLIDVINSDRPLVIARINSQEEYDLLKEVLL